MMTRLSSILIVVAVTLLVVSRLPWPSLAPAAANPAAPSVNPSGAVVAAAALTIQPEPTIEPSATPFDLAEHGRTLFMIKGCASCHTYTPLTGNGPSFGPNLTHYDPDPAFVRTWLRDPAAVRPATEMPDLDLNDGEIEALIAFLLLEE